MKRALVLMMCAALALQAKPPEIRVPWSGLDRELARSRVMIATEKAPVAEGTYVGLAGDSVRVETKRGEVRVARGEIRDLRRMEASRVRGRIIGTVAGVLGGLALGAVMAVTLIGDDSGETGKAIGVWLGTGAGVGALGYFIGKELDRRTTRIVILP